MKSLKYIIGKDTKFDIQYTNYILYAAGKDFENVDNRIIIRALPAIISFVGEKPGMLFILTYEETVEALGKDFQNWKPLNRYSHLWGTDKDIDFIHDVFEISDDVLKLKNKDIIQII